MVSAHELVAAGNPAAALAVLQQEVRARAADPKLRIFLFQLLAVLGQWQRALAQLRLCGELDAASLAMVGTYREALHCEAVREAVFAGKVVPHVFGRPLPWVALLAQALQSEAQGDLPGAQRCRSDALGQACATGGRLDGEAFDWITDADSRLGPVLEVVINGRYGWLPFESLRRVVVEAPTDLRDLVWAPAHLELPNGGATVALVPTRYAGSGGSADAALQMARRTEWVEIGPDQYRGLGLRTLVTDRSEVGLLEVRQIELTPAHEPGTAG
jgi:type VI secretion system protein ImpE